jgi:glutaredoxin 3
LSIAPRGVKVPIIGFSEDKERLTTRRTEIKRNGHLNMIAHLYKKEYCPFCVQALILLQKKNIQVIEINGIENREEMLERAAKHGAIARTFPQIFFVFDDEGEEYIGGYDELRDKYSRK